MAVIALVMLAGLAFAQDKLNPAGEPRYGRHALVPGFVPSPATYDALSGGDIDVKALNLGDNCLGFAASDPDFIISLAGEFRRITFLVASEADSTLIINLPNGSWACNDDSNGLNPALVLHRARAGDYQVWLGSYAAETNDESVLYISEAGPEALPTTATGPDPEREALYGTASLSAGFQPAPFRTQLLGGGRNRAADFISAEHCRGFVSEAPDFSVYLSGAFSEIWFALHSPADMTLLVYGSDGSWHCSDDRPDADPRLGFRQPLDGLYDIWVGSADEGNYAAAIFYVTEGEPNVAPDFAIDRRCDGLLETALQVGASAIVAEAAPAGLGAYTSPNEATTRLFSAPPGTRLSLVGGPVCRAAHRWWRADRGAGIVGWVADGDASTRWLDALP